MAKEKKRRERKDEQRGNQVGERAEEKGSGLGITPLPHTLPRIDDIFDQLSDSKQFTTRDFKLG